MIGSTCLKKDTVLNGSYNYMYSQNLRSSFQRKIGNSNLDKPYNKNVIDNMYGIMLLYNNKTGNAATSIEQLQNLDRLYDIKRLKEGWNGTGSKRINEIVVAMAENIVKGICKQPIIYPTGRDSIQMQYELEDKSYLEFEIFEKKIVCMKVPQRIYSKTSFITMMGVDIELINRIVRDFYGK